jgi:glycosyltransferase involved in cell wall biosynthesis
MAFRISAIVPIYKAAPYIEGLFSMLRQQTMQDFEVLFANDCSPDNSRDLIVAQSGTDPRFRLFDHDHNRGHGPARNTGLDHAQGDYITHIDADDGFSPDYFEKLLTACEKYDADVAQCNSYWHFDDRDEPHPNFHSTPGNPDAVHTGREALRRYLNLYENDFIVPVFPWGKLIRREMMEKYQIRCPDIRLHADIVLTFSELLFSRKWVQIPDYLYYYNRSNPNADTRARRAEFIEDIAIAPEQIFGIIKHWNMDEEMRDYMVRFYFGYVSGVYSRLSEGDLFLDEYMRGLETYQSIMFEIDESDIEKSKDFIADRLATHYHEMHYYGWDALFEFFIEPQKDLLVPLLESRGIFL